MNKFILMVCLLCFLISSVTPASAILYSCNTTYECHFNIEKDKDSFITLNNIANQMLYDYDVKLSFTRLNKHSFIYDKFMSDFQKDLLRKDGFLVIENETGLYYFDIADVDDKYQLFVLRDGDANTYIVERRNGYLNVKDYNGKNLKKITPTYVGYINSFHSKNETFALLQYYLDSTNHEFPKLSFFLNSTVTPSFILNNTGNSTLAAFLDKIYSSNFLQIISPHLRLKLVNKTYDELTIEDIPILVQNNDSYSIAVVQKRNNDDISVVLGDERFSRDYTRKNFMKYYTGLSFVKYSCVNNSNSSSGCNGTSINEIKSLLSTKLDFTALNYINYLIGELVEADGIFYHKAFSFCTRMMLSMYLMTGIRLGMKQCNFTEVKSELGNHQSSFILIKNLKDDYNILQVTGASETSTEVVQYGVQGQYERGWRLDKELNYEGIYFYSDQPGPFGEAIYVCRANILNNTLKSPYTYETFKEAVNKWFSKWEHPWDNGLISEGVMVVVNVMMISAAVTGAIVVVGKIATFAAGFTAAGSASVTAGGAALSAAATGIGIVVVGGILAVAALAWGIWKLTEHIKHKKDVKKHVKAFKNKYFPKK